MDIDIESAKERKDPQGRKQRAPQNSISTLPEHTRRNYVKRYTDFMDWCKLKNCRIDSEEDMLTYFTSLREGRKASTLFPLYSMLKLTLAELHNIQLENYTKLQTYIRIQNAGYEPIESPVLSKSQIIQFLKTAPDSQYLMMKVALIFGVAGACRRSELYNIRAQHIEERGEVIIVKVVTANQPTRTFSIVNDLENNIDCIKLYKTYAAIREKRKPTGDHFFIRYNNGKCTNNIVGINTFGRIPKVIAGYLNLDNADQYTGRCYRVSSAKILSNTNTGLLQSNYATRATQNEQSVQNLSEIPSSSMCDTEESLSTVNENNITDQGPYEDSQSVISSQDQGLSNDIDNNVGTVLKNGNLKIGSLNLLLQNCSDIKIFVNHTK